MVEVPAAVVAKGNPIESHLPAMKVAVDVDRGVGKTVIDKIISRRESEFPLVGKTEVTAEAKSLYRLALEIVFGRHIGADVAECVVKRQIPRHAEVGIGTDEGKRVVVDGCLEYVGCCPFV